MLAALARGDDDSGKTDDVAKAAAVQRRQRIVDAGGVTQLIQMLMAVSVASSIIARQMWQLVAKVIGATEKPTEGTLASGPAVADRSDTPTGQRPLRVLLGDVQKYRRAAGIGFGSATKVK